MEVVGVNSSIRGEMGAGELVMTIKVEDEYDSPAIAIADLTHLAEILRVTINEIVEEYAADGQELTNFNNLPGETD